MTDPTRLSSAAQAVLDAYRSTHLSINNLAAAMRAAADQLGYSNVPEEFADTRPYVIDTDELLAIADELEAQ